MGKFLFTFPFRLAIIIKLINAPVAQLDRVLASGAKGRGFKSRLAYQKDSLAPWGKGILFFHMPRTGGFLRGGVLIELREPFGDKKSQIFFSFYCFKSTGMV